MSNKYEGKTDNVETIQEVGAKENVNVNNSTHPRPDNNTNTKSPHYNPNYNESALNSRGVNSGKGNNANANEDKKVVNNGNDKGNNGSEPAAASTDALVKTLQDELEEARKKAAENWDLFLRARAEGDNARRRATIDVENAHKYGIEKFAKEIVSVVDSLDHGLEATKNISTENEKSLRDGMELSYKLLIATLDKFGVKQIDPAGEDFDPMKHEALSTMPGDDLKPNKVMNVVQKGFILQDRVLRPARVIVSKIDH